MLQEWGKMQEGLKTNRNRNYYISILRPRSTAARNSPALIPTPRPIELPNILHIPGVLIPAACSIENQLPCLTAAPQNLLCTQAAADPRRHTRETEIQKTSGTLHTFNRSVKSKAKQAQYPSKKPGFWEEQRSSGKEECFDKDRYHTS